MATRHAGPNPLKLFAGVFVVATLVVAGFLSATTVGTGEIAVMTRFGEVTGEELGEGFHWKNPLDKANVYSIQVQKEERQAAAASRDLQDANATVVLNYALAPGSVDDVHQDIGVNYKEQVILPAIDDTFKAATAEYNATSLITQRPQVRADVIEDLTARLEPYGIRVLDVSLTDFSFSEAFSTAIEQKQVAEQDAQRASFRLEAARIDAEAQEVQAQTLSPLYLQLKAIEEWDGKLPLYVGGGESGEIFGIPLDAAEARSGE